MLKRYRFILILSIVALATSSILPGPMGTVRAQNRHVMLEEFTGAWCGWCVRGALALEQLRAAYPDQVVCVSFHNDQGNPAYDQMGTLQGDTLAAGISGLASTTQVTGFPDGWTARTPVGGTWNVDPGSWIDTLNHTGTAEKMLSIPASVEVSVDNVKFDLASGTITARVNAKFDSSMSGNFRLSLYVVEDSVTGTGDGWDQHNYYYQNSSFPTSPYYNRGTAYYVNGSFDGSTIPGFTHMQVFRYCPGPIWGTAGVIPASVAAPTSYNQTYSFKLPQSVQNPNHVHLIGLVTKYSTSSLAANQIMDAAEVPLNAVPIVSQPNNIVLSADNGPYFPAHAGGDTPIALTINNNGNSPMSVTLQPDPNFVLPAGWSIKFSKPTIQVDAGASQPVTMTVTSPMQADYVPISILVMPQVVGEPTIYIPTGADTMAALSDDAYYGIYRTPGWTSASSFMTGMPDSAKMHTATIPLDPTATSAFPISNMNLAIFDNDPVLGGTYTIPPNSVADVTSILTAGGKVFFTSADAMAYQYNTTDTHYAAASTSDADNFFANILGLSYRTSESRQNASTGAFTSYQIKGTTDPIGNGVPLISLSGSDYDSPFDIVAVGSSTPSVPLFYFDNKPTYNAGVRYTDPVTGGKMVYLGFALNTFPTANKKWADSIAARSIAWLFGTASAGVADQAVAPVGISASPNPFTGVSTIQYTAAPDELNVTFSAFDLLGREIATLPSHNTGGNVYSAAFDASKLAEGTYTIVAHTSKGTHEVRVVNQQ